MQIVVEHKISSEIVKVLIKAGADVDARGRYNIPILIFAIYAESPEIVEILIEPRVDVNTTDQYRRTTLDIALHQRSEIIRYITC